MARHRDRCRDGGRRHPFGTGSLTRTVAELAVVTGIAPRFLMEDQAMLSAMIDVVEEIAEQRRKAGG
jgi:hypothetical protein